jgi:hypothetical protein
MATSPLALCLSPGVQSRLPLPLQPYPRNSEVAAQPRCRSSMETRLAKCENSCLLIRMVTGGHFFCGMTTLKIFIDIVLKSYETCRTFRTVAPDHTESCVLEQRRGNLEAVRSLKRVNKKFIKTNGEE